ncbi:hypothetical protein [Marinobacter sp. BSs20148]|jgi:hypothetical protein|uniref:hypothetical protein n=1 Tax=Marinobacter sp. BSs20148 TaxID=490759 RepID=UPI00027767A5|nr:hypothetical protein [Marinobacter sp. BSs20148]AFP29008.1 hypothetical protein MRBBS_0070 [Marinobacter sp. BSs20148]
MTQKTAFSALHSSPATSRELFTALAAGAVLLLVVHGLGRFMVSANKSAPTFRLADCTH